MSVGARGGRASLERLVTGAQPARGPPFRNCALGAQFTPSRRAWARGGEARSHVWRSPGGSLARAEMAEPPSMGPPRAATGHCQAAGLCPRPFSRETPRETREATLGARLRLRGRTRTAPLTSARGFLKFWNPSGRGGDFRARITAAHSATITLHGERRRSSGGIRGDLRAGPPRPQGSIPAVSLGGRAGHVR